jgi:hypothetical protein
MLYSGSLRGPDEAAKGIQNSLEPCSRSPSAEDRRMSAVQTVRLAKMTM